MFTLFRFFLNKNSGFAQCRLFKLRYTYSCAIQGLGSWAVFYGGIGLCLFVFLKRSYQRSMYLCVQQGYLQTIGKGCPFLGTPRFV